MSFDTLVDGARITKAQNEHAALKKAEVEAKAALEQAGKDAKAAAAAAQKAADAGADLDALMKAEEAVEVANRRLSVARRMADGAARRREQGDATLANELRQAHGAAMNSAMQRFIDIRSEALDVFAKLEALKAEHKEVRAEIGRLGNVAKAGVPNIVDVCRELVNSHDGRMMDQKEWDNRVNQNSHHEWDVVAGKLRWTE